MRKSKKTFIALSLMAFITAGPALAHYHVLVPAEYNKWQARKTEMVHLRLLWGHGYEHIWFDAETPRSLWALPPEGERLDLMDELQKDRVRAVSGKERASFKLNYPPSSRGDHILALVAGRQWDAESSEWLQDYVKTLLHVQVEKGWSRRVGHPLEVVPLSRPYGVLPGDALRFRVLYKDKPAAALRVERELLSAKAPDPAGLPSEAFIAYPARTGADGTVVFSFPSSGWYGITAIRGSGKEYEKDGHTGELIERSTLWVYVSEKPE
ncbi:MAG: DUF4198 domain-containing protein [bacterium]